MKRAFLFIMCLIFLIFAMLLLGNTVRAAERSFYDRDGHFAGSSSTYNGARNESFYDRSGHFGGSAVRNSDGTTSFYDRNGHFEGSSK